MIFQLPAFSNFLFTAKVIICLVGTKQKPSPNIPKIIFDVGKTTSDVEKNYIRHNSNYIRPFFVHLQHPEKQIVTNNSQNYCNFLCFNCLHNFHRYKAYVLKSAICRNCFNFFVFLFEVHFWGSSVILMRRIAGYLTKKNGGHDQKDAQGTGGN